MTAPRPHDGLTADEREPVPVTCRCGHSWLTRAARHANVRCPACKTTCRVKRNVPGFAQVSAPPALPRVDASSAALVRTRMPAPPAVRTRERPAARSENRLADLARLWRSAPGPPGVLVPEPPRRFLAADEDEYSSTLIGTVTVGGMRLRGRKSRTADCDYCGAAPGYMSPGLYRVKSPAMLSERVLCYLHMLTEMSVPGASVVRIA